MYPRLGGAHRNVADYVDLINQALFEIDDLIA